MGKQIRLSELFEKDDGLFDFIARKQLDYEEPQRIGTPRGEKIGFSAKKYQASMLVGLTNIKLKKLAKDLNRKYGLSYGLLRKWKTEDDFMAEAKKHVKEFAGLVLKLIEKSVSKHYEEYNRYYDCKTDERPKPMGFPALYRDAQIFSKELINELSMLAQERGKAIGQKFLNKKLNGKKFAVEWRIFQEIKGIVELAEGKATKNIKLRIFRIQAPIIWVKDLINSKRVFSKREQRIIIDSLTDVIESLEDIRRDYGSE